MIKIVKAESPSHIEAIRTLLQEYAEMRNHDAALGDYQKELQQLPGKYASPDGCLLLAYFDSKPAGCVAFQKIGEGICEMKRMFVSQSFQGFGIGKQLLFNIVLEAQKAGYQLMRLDTHPWMKQAQKLYTGFGFYEIKAYNNNPTKGIRFFEKKL